MALPAKGPHIYTDAQPANAMQFLVVIAAANTPVLLIPSNSKRVALQISNSNLVYPLFFSYNNPMTFQGVPVGSVIAGQVCFDTVGLYVPIQDIWVWYPVGPTFPTYGTGFELTATPVARP